MENQMVVDFFLLFGNSNGLILVFIQKEILRLPSTDDNAPLVTVLFHHNLLLIIVGSFIFSFWNGKLKNFMFKMNIMHKDDAFVSKVKPSV
ncbi:hypothetical protein BLOT_005224 [Blomia tropicalis]|nr:hypothetical protein BLOT_005224 [Blomia tropicalis]